MGLTRRQAIITSLGVLALGGCSKTVQQTNPGRPIAPWSGYPANPSGRHSSVPVQPPRQPIVRPGTPQVVTNTAGVSAISRSKWTRSGPARSKVNAMNGISKLTIHHDGMDPSYITNQSDVADRIEKIRKYHTGHNGWGDIGYHYIVDRAGRVWEGRAIQYQGAHVRNNNENNVGILVLGNFDKQSPSNAQLKALHKTVDDLAKKHKIKSRLVRSHQEINKTACPGRNLQKQMDGIRRHVA
ncbi:MAG: peptidoglycan recognition family protein [Planctomycetota bacterium]